MKADPVKKHGRLRTAVQLGFAVFFNGYAAGFFRAKILALGSTFFIWRKSKGKKD